MPIPAAIESRQASLQELSHFRTGGTCEVLYSPRNAEELSAVVRELTRNQRPYFLLGSGSNSLIWDEQPWNGAVISFHQMTSCEQQGTSLFCGAGVVNSSLAQYAYDQGLAGLAWMYRLPGQMGATVRMNARCYGGEISQVARRVITVSPKDGRIKTYENPAGSRTLFRGYKDTIFMDNGEIVAAVELALTPASNPQADLAKMQACEDDREKKMQFLHPNCGCVFKNDYSSEVSVSSGLLLELAGVKGLSRGQAMVSPYHCNFIYNQGATSRDILELSLAMREAVWQKFGVWLAYEMEILGELPAELAARVHEERPAAYQHEALAAARQTFQQRLAQV